MICPFAVAESEAAHWAQRELSHLSNYDPRLVRRLATMLGDWSAQPQAVIPEASRSAAAAKASYRLLSNPRVEAVEVESSHREPTWQRKAEHSVVLAVADTNSFNLKQPGANRRTRSHRLGQGANAGIFAACGSRF